MTPTRAFPFLVTVRPEFAREGDNALLTHLPAREAGIAYSGPTVYVTECGLYAHGRMSDSSDVAATCARCAR